jgi:dTDP-4-amino-4,6-dideoxygalactose transaminase
VKIKFNQPWVSPNAQKYIGMALNQDNLTGDGQFVDLAISALSEFYGHDRIILTPSGTASLELASLVLELGAGSDVSIPSFNFSSVVTAVANYGARVNFCEVDSSWGSAGAEHLLAASESMPDAVSYVNYAGMHQDPVAIERTFRQSRVPVIEDNAHGLGGSFEGRALGTFGNISALSFHGTKNLPLGEGGAAVINDESLWERAQMVRDKGSNRKQYISGQVDKYTWHTLGSSFLMSNVMAAFLLAQLENFEAAQSHRAKIVEAYRDSLAPLAEAGVLEMMPEAIGDTGANHIFFVKLQDNQIRNSVLTALRGQGIEVSTHYEALHRSPAASRLGFSKELLPNTDDFAGRLLRLPVNSSLGLCDVRLIASSLTSCLSTTH